MKVQLYTLGGFMFFSGLFHLPKEGSPISSAHLITAFEDHAYDVKQDGLEITLLAPGFDALFFRAFESLSMPLDTSTWENVARPLWNQLTFTLNPEDGSINYAMNYWTKGQLILHAFINILISIDFILHPQTTSLKQMLAIFMVGNALPILASHLNGLVFIRTVLKKLNPQS